MRRVALSFLLALYAGVPAAAAQNQPDTTARIAGTVRSSVDGLPMPGVTLSLRGTTAVSDSTGVFALAHLPSGRQTLRIHYGDTLSHDEEMKLEPGKALILAVLLDAAEDDAMTPIIVDESDFRGWRSLAGFYHRKKSGRGRFYTLADLAPLSHMLLQTFLSGSGVTLRCRQRSCVPLAFNGARRCVMALFLNGDLVPPDYLETLRLDRLAGVEVYLQPVDVPQQFRSAFAADCGAMMMWSRN